MGKVSELANAIRVLGVVENGVLFVGTTSMYEHATEISPDELPEVLGEALEMLRAEIDFRKVVIYGA